MKYVDSQPDHNISYRNITFKGFQYRDSDHALTNLPLRKFPEILRDPDLFNINIGTIALVAATFRSPLVAAWRLPLRVCAEGAMFYLSSCFSERDSLLSSDWKKTE